MTKRSIIKWLMWALAAQLPAGILLSASAMALASHLSTDAGANVNDGYSTTMLTLIAVGSIFLLGSVVAGLMAWVGALINAGRCAETTWCNALRWSGVLGIVTIPLFGLGVLIVGGATLAYVVGGPERIGAEQPEVSMSPPAPVMAKPVMVKWAAWGLVAIGVGGALALFFSHSTNQGGFLHGQLWTAMALIWACMSLAVTGLIAEAVAWWGALFNSHQLAAKTWFNVLLWSGIVGTVFSFPFGEGALISGSVLIAYLIAGPGASVLPPQSAQPMPPPLGPPTSNVRAV